ncbi:MAG: hypothetical protein KDC71_14555 [Acidobacteria bacterium]|nr:hypothetical protein [Acidobacteriota bacterium]
MHLHLVHWNEKEAHALMQSLSSSHSCSFWPMDRAGLKRLTSLEMDAILIDCNRLPSHCLEVAIALRMSKKTRFFPLIFLSDTPEKFEKIRAVLPDAQFGQASDLDAILSHVKQNPLEAPIVPASVLAGYSKTPLAKKLGIKVGMHVSLYQAPEAIEAVLQPLPDGVDLQFHPASAGDLVLWFAEDLAQLEMLPDFLAQLGQQGIWIIWPKKSSVLASDIDGNAVRSMGLAHGLVDFKVCALNDTWSGLKFVRRKN